MSVHSYFHRTFILVLALLFANTWSGAQPSQPFLPNLGLVRSEKSVIIAETATSTLIFHSGKLIVSDKKTKSTKAILDQIFAVNQVIKEKDGVFIFSKSYYSFDTLTKVDPINLKIISTTNDYSRERVQVINKPTFFIVISPIIESDMPYFSSIPDQIFILKDSLQIQTFRGEFLRTYNNTVFTFEAVSRQDFFSCLDCFEKIFSLKFRAFTPDIGQREDHLSLIPILFEQVSMGPRKNCEDLSKLKVRFSPYYRGLLNDRYAFEETDSCGTYLALINPNNLNNIVFKSK